MLTRTPASKDRIAGKRPLLVGLLKTYRQITKQRDLQPELLERPTETVRVEDRRRELVEFYEAYEDFVECLCDAAQTGIVAALEERYLQSRSQLVAEYARLRCFLGAYLRPSGDDARGAAPGIRFDAFDALLACPTLELFLDSDDGHTISRITRTREALHLYGEHLRHLVERTR